MPRAGFELAIPMFERLKTVLALERAAIETGAFELSRPHINSRRKWLAAVLVTDMKLILLKELFKFRAPVADLCL
jgi:hypothetical protein